MNYWKHFKLVFFFCILSFSANAQTKRALVITISKYLPKSGWVNLSADKDKETIEQILNYQKFNVANIKFLEDDNATKKNIISALNSLADVSKPNDQIIIHFSGHGQQLSDLNGDEEDCLDEALVPYDAPSNNINGKYKGEKHLIDDELGFFLTKIQNKVGKNGVVMFFVDACHSGTINRGDEKFVVRSGSPMKLSGAKENCQKTEQFHFNELKKSNECPLIVITGSKAEQPSIDIRGHGGRLTLALQEAFFKLSPKSTYLDFFHNVYTTVTSKPGKKQEPQLIVNSVGLERKAFMNNEFVSLSLIEQFAFNVKNTESKVISLIKDNSNEAFISEAINDDYNDETFQFWNLIDSNVMVDTQVCYFFSPNRLNKALKGRVQKALKGNKYLLEVNNIQNADVEIYEDKGKVCIEVVENKSEFIKLDINDELYNNVKVDLEKYFYQMWLKNVDILNPNYNLSMDLQIAEWDTTISDLGQYPNSLGNIKYSIDTTDKVEKDTLGFEHFNTKQKTMLIIKNNSDLDCYFNLMDIQPDGRMFIKMPSDFIRPEMCHVKANSEILIPLSPMLPPYGIESFVLIGSTKPFDLSALSYDINRNNTANSKGGERSTIDSQKFFTLKNTFRIVE
jgi:hypothetical protein